jgi:2-iminobutanoate/2-iminopropanoate deaminase
MSKEIINTKEAPAAIGPYVQAVKSNGILFISGQLGIEAKTGDLPESVEEQAENSLKNLDAIMKEAGTDKSKVLKTTIFLADMGDFGKVNEIYGNYFEGNNPARSCYAVVGLPKGGKVEIECMVEA